ncbi:MAG: PaaI family thioesterase [Cohaesibacteraceae bacterium]|nr:PaaI family thioesterase [Cohaesibacteraceae bacterium]MBL4875137.1 PaaI family thioesterase [Cohaesibacteraceae bacterium]
MKPNFKVRDPDYKTRVSNDFSRQGLMQTLGAKIVSIDPGKVSISMEIHDGLTQQHGYFHAGATSAIADSAAGYAAFTLFEVGAQVMTTEYKLNLLNPASGPKLIARGEIIKSGRTLSIARSDVFSITEAGEIHVATGLFSLIKLH